MTTLQISNICPIGTDCFIKYSGLACDERFFYLTLAKCCEIHKYDKDLKKKESFNVCREYSSLAYDSCLKCFWATAPKECNKIFKLNSCMKEIDCITVNNCDPCNPIALTGVSCEKKESNLLVACNAGIVKIEKKNCAAPCILQKSSPRCLFTSVQSLDGCYLAAACCNLGQTLALFNQCNETILQCFPIDEYKIEDMCSSCGCEKSPVIYILATKCGTYSYIMKGTLKSTHCCNDSSEISSTNDIATCLMNLLNVNGSSEDDFNCAASTKKCCSESCCGCGASSESCCGCGASSKSCCGSCNDDPCHNTPDRKGCCNNILHSIALIEAALSHILNAEGEKIQKILCVTDSPCEIIRVNEAVNKTIINITQLEHVLYSKLQLTKELSEGKDNCCLNIGCGCDD
ncbi:MAG: hypothetical protein RR352_07590 [Clostridia bacterium]